MLSSTLALQNQHQMFRHREEEEEEEKATGGRTNIVQRAVMESTMDQARSTISKIFCGEPRSYTRFNLAKNVEGDTSQVELKLSSDVEEEAPNAAVDLPGQDTYSHQPSTPSRPRKNVVFIVISILLVFIIGYLIGYLTNRRQGVEPPVCDSLSDSDPTSETTFPETESDPELDWSDIRSLLQNKLTAERFEVMLSELTLDSHEAGSDGDQHLGNKVNDAFQTYGMNTWIDEHFVKVQTLPSSSSNKVMFGGDEIGVTKGYLSYSAKGIQQGRVVYVHYGQPDDFKYVMDMKIDLNGAIVLLRAGKMSFAEKVANAAKLKAAAVLIYLDPADFEGPDLMNTELYGHVHLGSGDPYTPGFPSFNHTQFPPALSSGLPGILAQTITSSMATKIFQKMGGLSAPSSWAGGRLLSGVSYNLGGENDTVTVEVNNVLVEKSIHNVFGVIKGFVDPDLFVVIGAQRDSWGPGYARSTVGTSMLLELARAVSDMVKNDGFKPRRSMVFASWSAGEYGSIGATEWLEGYLASLNMKAFSYINLDGAVTGNQAFKASASPLLYDLVLRTLKEVKSPIGPTTSQKSLFQQVGGMNWEDNVMVPMPMDDSAYPFMAFSGIPSVSFRFAPLGGSDYPYFGTILDTKDQLDWATAQSTAQLTATSAHIAGQMALRLVHDHLLRLDVKRFTPRLPVYPPACLPAYPPACLPAYLSCLPLSYSAKVGAQVTEISYHVDQLQQSGVVSGPLMKTLSVTWLMSAIGSYRRASAGLTTEIKNTDLTDTETCRKINDRIMRVEQGLLSPYVSPKDTPFRHIIFGFGSHTLGALLDHLNAMKVRSPDSNIDVFRNQFALATWTIQGCANNLAGLVWELDN
ncbi:hypothetical protein AAFF_G00013830 [Aldrovandia affinis]|uniref:Transferrin receptor protein 1 n=1 Tax=Aldrovandia affinis TaxID=143900 RepID=A0AAD7S6D7_9TELE|nr:hypothetical protein AAFF_G00013830 [Aldrovandia affinis]